MDHTRDNPLKRFTAFWIALLLVTAFGIACIILRPLTHASQETAYQIKEEERLKIKSEIDSANDSAFDEDSLAKAISEQAASFKTNTPTAGGMALPGAAPAPAPETEAAEQ